MSDRDGINFLTDDEQTDYYDQMLDDIYPDVEIAGLSYSVSHAQKEIDPTAYRCGMVDFFASGNFVEREFDGETVLVDADDADEWDDLDLDDGIAV